MSTTVNNIGHTTASTPSTTSGSLGLPVNFEKNQAFRLKLEQQKRQAAAMLKMKLLLICGTAALAGFFLSKM